MAWRLSWSVVKSVGFWGFGKGEEESKASLFQKAVKMDKSMLGDLSSLPEEDKLRMSALIDQLQIRNSLRMYNSLVERCFTDCVDNFRRKSLDKQEETCVHRC